MALLSREELRVLMLPWVGVLRDYVDLGEWHATWDANGDRVVWMQMVSDAPRGIEPRAFDAMELLTLLGEIDFAAWRVALAASWPRHASAWIEAANGRALRFGWKLVFRSASANDAAAMDIAKWCDRIVLDGAARTRSREYLRARNVLEDQYRQLEVMAAERAVRKPVARERLLIPVQLVMKDGPLETRLLKLLQIAALQHARESSSGGMVFQEDPWKPLMRITDVIIKDHAEQASTKAFISATQLAAFDIRLNQLSLDRVDVTIDTAMLYTTGLQYLLAANGVGHDKQVRVGAARWVVVPAAMRRQTITAIFSALLVSSSVRTVAVNMTPVVQRTEDVDVTKICIEDRDHMWQWAAVSLFSDHSRNHVEHVEIDVGGLCQNDVTAMQRALAHQNPLHALSLPASVASSRAVAIDEYVFASKFRLLPPESEAPRGVDPEIHLERQQAQVLMRLSDGWSAVQLPGWGTAWVHKDDCEDCTGRPVLPSAQRGISSLKLTNITGSSTTPVVSLLRLVGRHIRTLEITRIRLIEPLDDWLREIFQACPSLEDLTVSNGGHMMTLDTLIDSYEQGYCRLRNFALQETSVQDAADVPRFINTLADPTHAMTKHLRELTLRYRSNTPLPGVSEALHAMLAVNTTMESFKMLIGFHSPMASDQLIRPRAFSKYMIPIAVRLLPLSLSKKAAFLRVITGRRDQGPQEASSALQQFDSRVVSLIFQFAAQCRKRNVAVHFWNTHN